jgi:aspartate aminotransferase
LSKELSKVACAIAPSATLQIDAMYKKMQADGKAVVGFGAGEPDFPTPENIKEAGRRAIETNLTRYTPAAGVLDLRKAIAKHIEKKFNVQYTPSQIVVSSGAKHSLFEIFQTICNPKDEIILPTPIWLSYDEMIHMANATPVHVLTTSESGFHMTPEQLKAAITPKTKAVLFNSPCNPTGAVYTKEELVALTKICVEEDLYIISDEIYEELLYDNLSAVCVPSLSQAVKDHTILVNGVSKSYSMTGWRIGWTCAPEPVAKVLSNLQSHAASAPSTMSQYAAIEALEGPQDSVSEMREEFGRRRDFFLSRLEKIPGVSAVKPEGAFYVFMDIRQVLGKEHFGEKIETSSQFASSFLLHGGVAVVPSESFGIDGFLRWSYATSMDSITKGLDRLESFLVGVETKI